MYVKLLLGEIKGTFIILVRYEEYNSTSDIRLSYVNLF